MDRIQRMKECAQFLIDYSERNTSMGTAQWSLSALKGEIQLYLKEVVPTYKDPGCNYCWSRIAYREHSKLFVTRLTSSLKSNPREARPSPVVRLVEDFAKLCSNCSKELDLKQVGDSLQKTEYWGELTNSFNQISLPVKRSVK